MVRLSLGRSFGRRAAGYAIVAPPIRPPGGEEGWGVGIAYLFMFVQLPIKFAQGSGPGSGPGLTVIDPGSRAAAGQQAEPQQGRVRITGTNP
jgi:hypothetical protein